MVRKLIIFIPFFVARNNFFSSFVFLPPCNNIARRFCFYSTPNKAPEIFQALKLVPSGSP